MRSNRKIWQGMVAAIAVAVGLAAAPKALARGVDPWAYPPDTNVAGMTYGDWSAAWWQWVLSIPAAQNPLMDTSGANCTQAQGTGPVFFLAGSFVGPVTRACTVPAGKTIVFPVINVECSSLEDPPFFGDDEAKLRACAGGFGDGIDPATVSVQLDQKKLKAPDGYQAQSPVFGFTLPAENVLGVDTAAKGFRGTSVGDGYWVILRALKPGAHTVHFQAACLPGSLCEGFTQDVTYLLTVLP